MFFYLLGGDSFPATPFVRHGTHAQDGHALAMLGKSLGNNGVCMAAFDDSLGFSHLRRFPDGSAANWRPCGARLAKCSQNPIRRSLPAKGLAAQNGGGKSRQQTVGNQLLQRTSGRAMSVPLPTPDSQKASKK